MPGKNSFFYRYCLLIMLISLCSCYPTRSLKRGEQWLLKSNKVKIEGKAEIDIDNLRAIIKQRPNRIIGFGDLVLLRLNLRVYELLDTAKVNRNIERKKERLAVKNEQRRAKGKREKPYTRTFSQYLLEQVGEPPVIYDTARTRVSMEQMSLEMLKHGYFNNRIDTVLKYRPVKKMVKVTYVVHPGPAYTIQTFQVNIPDHRLKALYDQNVAKSMVKAGNIYNYYTLDAERQRLVGIFKNNGFFAFTRDYIRYDVDSSIGGNKVNVLLNVRDFLEENDTGRVSVPHTLYAMRYYYVYPNYNFFNPGQVYSDTITNGNIRIIHNKDLNINPKLLYNNLLFEVPFYKQLEADETYRSLSSLNLYRNIRIEFKPVENVSPRDKLDGFIYLAPGKRFSFTTEARVETRANNGGSKNTQSNFNLGISGSVSLIKRNAFRNGEILKFGISGGLEPFFLTDSAANARFFNTTEFGPTMSITFPRFLLPIGQEKFAKSARAKTIMSFSYNDLANKDLKRRASKFVLGYEWNETTVKRHILNPIEFSIIKAFISPNLENRLIAIGDPFLRNTYSDQFILGSSYSFLLSDQFTPRSQKALYNRAKVESAGSLLRLLAGPAGLEQDADMNYTIAGITFAQYLKLENEFKTYRKTFFNNIVAFRLFGGVAKPLTNSKALPFEKSYYAGGTNGIRAWGARSLGPGGYLDTTTFRGYLNRIGEIHLESNVEYRVKFTKLIEWAFFADAGNIWVFKERGMRTNTEFSKDFINQIAVGGGVGLRLDFTFFLFRFDVAWPLHDPSLPVGERWFYQDKPKYNEIVDRYNARNELSGRDRVGHYRVKPNLNIGIGYPF